MKGYWKHIAASASITAVFVICALALAVSAVPVNAPAVEAASTEYRSASLAASFARIARAVDEAGVAVPEAEASEPAIQTVAQPAAQPDPATAAPVQADPPAAAPEAKQPDEEDQPQAAKPPPPPEWNPPIDLTGEFVPDLPPYIELAWDPNNPKRYLAYCLIYREVVGQPGISVVQSKKRKYKDYDITPGLTYRYWVTAVSKSGEESGPSNIIVVETQVTDPPAPPQGVVAAGIDPGVSLDWQPNGEGNLAAYNVYYERHGRWRQLNRGVLTDNHYYYKRGTAGQTYAVSAVNVFGIESGYTVVQAQETTPVIYQEDDPAVTFEGQWVIENYEGASGGSIIVAGTAGERLHFTFTGRQVKLIAANYWTCGDARIYIDGELMGTVSMYSYDPVFQTIDISVPGLKYRQHVLTLEVVGSGNPETNFDFVNADAFEVR